MKVVVTKRYGYDDKGSPRYFELTPNADNSPQTVVNRVGQAAIAAGCAEEYKPEMNKKGKTNGVS